MKHLKSAIAWIVAMMSDKQNCIITKLVVASMTNDFEVDVIEIVFWVDVLFFVQIVNMNSTIWRFNRELASDLNENEFQQSESDVNFVICEQLIWDDETLYDDVARQTVIQIWLYAIVSAMIIAMLCDTQMLDEIDEIGENELSDV